jgi:Glycosyltransferase family 87
MPAPEIAPDIRESRELPLPPVLRMYWIALFVLSAISALASDIYYYTNRFRQCCTLPADAPLFCDFWVYNYTFRSFHSAAFFKSSVRFAYPSFSAVVYDILYHLGPHSQAIYLTSELIACGLAAILFFAKIRRIGLRAFPAAILIVCTLLFSYPLMLLFMTGNIEIFTCILTTAGLWAALKKHNNAAAMLWGAAAALKLYPILLLGIFLSRAKGRSLAVGIATFVGLSVLSMWFIGPTIPAAFAGSLSGLGGFVSVYAGMVRSPELPFDHSLLAPWKLLGYYLSGHNGAIPHPTMPYLLIAATVALLAFFLRAWRLPITNQVIFFYAAMVALPPTSYDYTLMHLYAPWAMLVVVALRTSNAGRTLPGLRTCFLCCAVLFSSQIFLYFRVWIHPNGIFKSMALVALIVSALRHPIPDEALYGTIQPESAQRRESQDVQQIPAASASVEA